MDKFSHLDDQQLLEKYYADRDNRWLGILLQRYTLLLLGVCMKYLKNEDLARDSVQQVFLKAITELDKYSVTYFKSWIYKVACNHCLMQLRDKTGKNTLQIPEHLKLEDEAACFEENHLPEKSVEHLAQALQELNKGQQQCITLFYLEKKSYQQISEQTGYTPLQVKSFIQNGKRNLRILIEQKLKNNK
jgi:RNA polymerase sigma factor (sigma-70 family)